MSNFQDKQNSITLFSCTTFFPLGKPSAIGIFVQGGKSIWVGLSMVAKMACCNLRWDNLSGFRGNSFGSISVSHCTTNIFAQKRNAEIWNYIFLVSTFKKNN